LQSYGGLKLQDLEICSAIFVDFFLEKQPLTLNFQNSVPKVFTATPIDVVLFKFREMLPTGNQLMRYLPDKKFRLPLKHLLLHGLDCSRFHPNWFTFGIKVHPGKNWYRLPNL